MTQKTAALMVLLAALVLLDLTFLSLQNTTTQKYSTFTLNQMTYNITYVASNESALEHGLMNTTVTNSTTMLFVFPNPSIYPFWMLDTYTNLDMIWINSSNGEGKIVYIQQNATSCFDAASCTVYTPDKAANYVIETKSGFVSKNNVYVGEKISFG